LNSIAGSDKPVLYVDTPAALDSLCAQLADASWFAMDTEFLREKTYYPKLCLLQVATPDVVACVDPLALDNLAPMLALLADPNITKVMHSARQDMEIFYHLAGSPPAPVFDTQIAAPLLGLADQIGYANLVKEMLGVTLGKLHTRADWSLRPLGEEQLRYAADDVIYLAALYQPLQDRLQSLGRLDWLDEDFRQLANPELYAISPANAWLKVKGANRLKGASLSILQALASWREQQACQKDRPRGWMLRDDTMVDIARHKPTTMQALSAIRGLSEGLLKRSGNELLEIIGKAVGEPPAPFPDSGTRNRLSAEQDALVDVMMAVVRISAVENSLNPTVLASRKQLEALLLGDTETGVMQGWRRKLVGERLQQLLNGELKLAVKDGRLLL
jgi:ribonuclease D